MKEEVKKIIDGLNDLKNYSNFIDSQYGGNNYYYLLEIREGKKLLRYLYNLQDRINNAMKYMNNTFDIKDAKDMFEIMNKLEDILNGDCDE